MSRPPSSRWPPERCAVRARERGDHMLGTAFPAARLLLVEEPFPWGPEGLRTSRFHRGTALALEARCRDESVRVQAIRRLGRNPRGERRWWALVDTRSEASSVVWGEFAEDPELLELPLDGSTGDPDSEPLYLVCTHGKHDPCCGGRGHALAAALQEVRPGRVWQASHLGGCRFAPTVLVLPLGLMYGRVPATAVGGLVAAAEAGELAPGDPEAVGAPGNSAAPDILRGRIGLPPTAQAAVAFAHAQLGLPRCRDLTLEATTPVDAATVIVRVRAPTGLHDVTVRRERVDASGLTCGAPGPSWFVAHHPVSILPVEG